MPSIHTTFLLSPANCSGKRASLLREEGSSQLAQRLRSEGAPIGEVFTFLSGLYFRGKLAYATAFAAPPAGWHGAQVIVPGLGLRPADAGIDPSGLRAVAAVPVDPDDERYTGPLRRDAARLAVALGPDDATVLLGSLATRKYLEPLLDVLGTRLRVPLEFIGLGSMSRGSLLLRRVADGSELTYVDGSLLTETPRNSSRR